MKSLMATLALALACLLAFPCQASEEEEPCADLTDKAVGAALGDTVATYNLAVEFYTGKCLKQSYTNAATLWEKAAAAGDSSAKNNLGFLLSRGLGVSKDPARAAGLWLEAAQEGHVEAQLHLGDALFYGHGVPQDQALGLAWVLRANDLAATASEPGAGAELVQMAADGKAEFLGSNPEILDRATVIKATLETSPDGR
jgi:TPR repeat protein